MLKLSAQLFIGGSKSSNYLIGIFLSAAGEFTDSGLDFAEYIPGSQIAL
jgi:hypothetical protein